MEGKENIYITMDEAKSAIILDVRDLNLCYYNANSISELLFSLIGRILFYLNLYSGLLSVVYFIKSDDTLVFAPYMFAIVFGVLMVLLNWHRSYKESLSQKLEEDKASIAAVYFSKTKEFEQEEWIRNKIFEEEIMPLIS